MANLTEQQIDEFIQFINDTEEPESVTNSIVAAVLAFIANKIKTMASSEDIASVLNTIAAYFSDGKLKDDAIPAIVATKNDAGEIGYGTMPALVLNRINQPANGIGVAGQTCFCSDGKIRRYYSVASGGVEYTDSIEYNPSKKFPYYNLADGKFYIWKNNRMETVPGSGDESILERLDDIEAAIESMADVVEASFVGDTMVLTKVSVLNPIVSATGLNSPVVAKSGHSGQTSFTVSGRRLKGNISIAVQGTNAGMFTLDKSVLTRDDKNKVPTTNIAVTYTPTGNGSSHECDIVISSTDVEPITLHLEGNVLEQRITLTPPTLTLRSSGSKVSGIITVKGYVLDEGVLLSLPQSTEALSFAEDELLLTKSISKSAAEAGEQVTIYFDGSASTGSVTLTATSGELSSEASIVGELPVAFPVGTEFIKDGLKYTVLEDGTSVSVGGNNKEGIITIPSTINDYGIQVGQLIGSGFEYAVKAVEEVTLAAPTVDKTPFKNATKVVFPNSITTIPVNTFRNCDSLQEVVLGNAVTKIQDNAFNNCRALVSISGVENVAVIGGYAFSSCTSLTSIDFSSITSSNYGICRYSHNLNHVKYAGSSVWQNSFQSNPNTNPAKITFELLYSDAVVKFGGQNSYTAQGSTWWTNVFNSETVDGVDRIKIDLIVPTGMEAQYAATAWGQALTINGEEPSHWT